MVNYHSHLAGCTDNASLREVCIACRFDKFNAIHEAATARGASSIMGKPFEQQLNSEDTKLLHAMLISWKQETP